MNEQVVIVGAGVGGLATAAELARSGVDVTVLEAHVYPGGCAGTFFHKGYRFDAGATLAAGFNPGAPMDLLARRFDIDWAARPAAHAMDVHLPDGAVVARWGNAQQWQDERLHQFGPDAEPFWQWQERTADALWDLALRLPSWPPQSIADTASLASHGLGWLSAGGVSNRLRHSPMLALDALRPVATHLRGASQRLRQFVDAQLLISAQVTSDHANALYGSAALDLARLGVAHVPGGMGAIATKLADAVERSGGVIKYRQQATGVSFEGVRPVSVQTKGGDSFPADQVLFNLPPWNIAQILGDLAPKKLRDLPSLSRHGWGAFMVYVGLDTGIIPADGPLHHQVITSEPLGEGGSLFLSLSPDWDRERAPTGRRALTISTHTALEPWWRIHNSDVQAYGERKEMYTERLMRAGEIALPGLRDAADLVMPGSPVAFQRFTRRHLGWVGGFPQTSLFRSWGPRLAPNLWMVGDSIFPGQSVPAVALGGLRVAQAVLTESGAFSAVSTSTSAALPTSFPSQPDPAP